VGLVPHRTLLVSRVRPEPSTINPVNLVADACCALWDRLPRNKVQTAVQYALLVAWVPTPPAREVPLAPNALSALIATPRVHLVRHLAFPVL
jgi:hypothetical protein